MSTQHTSDSAATATSPAGQAATDARLPQDVLDRLKRDRDGLVAAVVQDDVTDRVLMLGWMDEEALRRTLTTGRVTFWSRSRQEYWRKGDTSGHTQWVRSVALDCDGDALLVRAVQVGAACHTGARSCFDGHELPAVQGTPPEPAGTQKPEAAPEEPTIVPDLAGFRALAADRRVVPVTAKVSADSLTPIGLYRALAAPDGTSRPGTFLLESHHEGTAWSRWSFVGVNSRATLTAKDGVPQWQGTVPAGAPTEGEAVDAVRRTLEMLHTEPVEGLPPLTSGLVGYLGWDTVRAWEKLPDPPEDDLGLPEMALNLVSDMAIHDHRDGTVTLVANAINWDGTDERVEEAHADAVARLRAMLADLHRPLADSGASVPEAAEDLERRLAEDVTESIGHDAFLETVARAQQAIVDGDIFQVVVSRRFSTPCTASPLDVYRVLRRTNPSPYMYLYTFAEEEGGEPFSVVGSSPEALVTVSEGRASTHPIAGSRPRGADRAADLALAEELLADEKERAEHLMLVDLARNDLSRIAEPGSVAVTQFMEIERFSHIMHISSTVEARLREDASAYDVLRATFPAGTLSGAPKPMAMRLLDEYEPVRRGVYGGVVGYFDFAGNMDMAIAIRTAVLAGGRALVQAGAGIVADSVPESEAAETVSKSAAPLRAVLQAEASAHRAASVQHPTGATAPKEENS